MTTATNLSNRSTNSPFAYLFLFALWTILVALCEYFFGFTDYLESVKLFYVSAVFLLVFGMFWPIRDTIFIKQPKYLLIWQILVISGLAVIFVAVTMSLITAAKTVYENKLVKAYQRDVASFRAKPDGFNYLKKFAMDNFHVQLILDNANMESWSYTVKTSPASMDFGWNFCILRINPSVVTHDFMSIKTSNPIDWVRVVSIHELGHCLDISRDYGDSVGKQNHVNSIAPADRAKVFDLETFSTASDTLGTQKWREVFADIYMIGYMRVKHPESAVELAQILADIRRKKSNDQSHQTSCWIDAAIKQALPADELKLIEWSDHIRSHSQCEI